MKEFIKIKVRDVLELFTILDRDITELNNTNKSISDNRDYSYSLKKSITDEIAKLESIKDSVLELEVDIPKSIYTRNHQGNPPKSHSAQEYGPGRRITYKPSSWAILQNSATLAWPVQLNSPGCFSVKFQNK